MTNPLLWLTVFSGIFVWKSI